MTTISEFFKGTKRVVKGYRIARKQYDGLYGPVYVNLHERWYKGKWYHAQYDEARWVSKYNNQVDRWGRYALKIESWFLGKKNNDVRPIAKSGKYEPGFHFFKTIEEARRAKRGNPKTVVLECLFKEMIVRGEQWRKDVYVARKQKILDEVL